MLRVLHKLNIVIILQMILITAPTEVLFLISSQDNSYHRQLGDNLRKDIIKQSHTLNSDYVINVRILHEIFNHPGDWTVLTALPHLTAGKSSIVNDNTKWIILCEDSTHIALQLLLNKLSQENHTQALYLGHPMHDLEASIIHHFAFFENPRWFPYPMLRAGVVFTAVLLKRVAALLGDIKGPRQRRTEFAIDAAHELALFILDNVRVELDRRLEVDTEGHEVAYGDSNEITPHSAYHVSAKEEKTFENVQKIILKRATYICPAAFAAASHKGRNDACAMYANPTDMKTCLPIKQEQIYFAIKTCHRFHKERIPIIAATWAAHALHKRYFSDVADPDIPTISAGVPNAEAGHCAKTLAILKLALKDIERLNRQLLRQDDEDIRWIFLSDDDTLLSVAGVVEILGCFDPLEDIYLGERYGYRLHADDGFNYITGGGGIALSLPVVRRILQHCNCPSPSAPDDMILGSCLHTLQVKAIHTSRFHQARPNDYPREVLQIEPPISFHKFWQLDALAVYEQWFANADRRLKKSANLRIKQKLKMSSTKNKSQKISKLLTNCQKNELDPADSIDAAAVMQLPQLSALQHHSKAEHLDL